jgi:hypothetical protein
MTRLAAALLLLAFALACGKYGPPVRAGQVEAERPAPRIEVPLPAPAPEAPGAEPAPPAEPGTEVEQEPPPEGTP